MTQQSTSDRSNHAGVWIPPPLLYVLPFLLARLLHSVIPLPLLPQSFALVAAIPFFAAGIMTATGRLPFLLLLGADKVPPRMEVTIIQTNLKLVPGQCIPIRRQRIKPPHLANGHATLRPGIYTSNRNQ